ncbi:hypothetical protein, partial [Mesorhizobium zhangyense]|uniref:hypothetical protein n=1 Tax=Mesorhizobium zhangyense TaxID=1776730 RepID=UPI00197BF2FE
SMLPTKNLNPDINQKPAEQPPPTFCRDHHRRCPDIRKSASLRLPNALQWPRRSLLLMVQAKDTSGMLSVRASLQLRGTRPNRL